MVLGEEDGALSSVWHLCSDVLLQEIEECNPGEVVEMDVTMAEIVGPSEEAFRAWGKGA